MVFDQRKAPGLKQEWGMGGLITAPQTPTAPATVCGERPFKVPLNLIPLRGDGLGRRKAALTRESGDWPCRVKQQCRRV